MDDFVGLSPSFNAGESRFFIIPECAATIFVVTLIFWVGSGPARNSNSFLRDDLVGLSRGTKVKHITLRTEGPPRRTRRSAPSHCSPAAASNSGEQPQVGFVLHVTDVHGIELGAACGWHEHISRKARVSPSRSTHPLRTGSQLFLPAAHRSQLFAPGYVVIILHALCPRFLVVDADR